MDYIVIGLGNPGEEYKRTRHNAGRMAVDAFRAESEFPEWEIDKKASTLVSRGEHGGRKVTLALPETYMNKSGTAVAKFAKSKKAAERVVVAYDDLDLPLGKIKLSFGRSSGGHRGVESIVRSLGTKDFVRVRIGVSSGAKKKGVVVAKKPSGEEKVLAFLMGNFKDSEESKLKAALKKAARAIDSIILHGVARAMNEHNIS